MMISPSNPHPPPCPIPPPPQVSPSQLPTTPQLGRFLRAPRPKTFTEVGATPPPANPPGRTASPRHQLPQATPHLPQPLHPPLLQIPLLPTHPAHLPWGVQPQRGPEDTLLSYETLQQVPPLPIVTPFLPPTCSPTRCLPGAGCCCSIILILRGTRGGLNTSLHGSKGWYPFILMVGNFCNHPTTTHHSTLAHSHPPNRLTGT